ncbi:hypothetical protein RHGRI_000683 [Rhododendron griersonianum]|uniref:Uncharacterized protein n=1 Tax=Rhododendron griersonianum TaxID=479676 RepID=A0AAV6LKN0_9ERIC|nr:hypothetical protein RHGRI_000683 [Rhododendron griersonianum]
MEVLGLGRNKFVDKFPRWLGNLPNLQVLILQSNKLHGSIPTSETKFPFPKLRVLDMSNNFFSGPLPKKYFTRFEAMMNVNEIDFHLDNYMITEGFLKDYYDSLTMVIKGSPIEMEQIVTIFTAIDLSSNKFEGEIPKSIGGLNSIRGLNLSHNSLTGHIPKSFGKQFDTFSNDSYINNLALCGPSLSNTCGDPKASQPPPPLTFEEEDSEPVSGFGWEVILLGYGFGRVVALVMGYLMFSFGKPLWLVKKVESVGNRNGKRYCGGGMKLLSVSDKSFWHIYEVDLMGDGNRDSTTIVRSFTLRV